MVMREVVKVSDQTQMQKQGNKPNNASKARSSSSWGSNIVKTFPNQDKKPKKILNSKPQNTSQNQNLAMSHSRVKRSLIGDLSCTINPVQVVCSGYHHRQGSRDLLVELDHLRGLISESRERECKLQAELSDCRRSLEREVEVGKSEVEDLRRRVGLLECEKERLSEQLMAAAVGSEDDRDGSSSSSFDFGMAAEGSVSRDLEMEVFELRRVNKELQMQKRSLSCRLSAAEAQLAGILPKGNESGIVAKIKAEASILRHTNEDLCKQVEGLQMSRLNEVEELAYLRWVNSCLRRELRNCSTDVNSDRTTSPGLIMTDGDSASSISAQSSESRDYTTAAKRVSFVKKFKKWPPSSQELQNFESSDDSSPGNWSQLSEERSPRRHSISGGKCGDDMFRSKRRQSDGFMCLKENEIGLEILFPPSCEWDLRQQSLLYANCHDSSKLAIPLEVEKRALRIPRPPPRPSRSYSIESKKGSSSQIQPPPPPLPPPPPPPPLSKISAKASAGVVKRAPQVLEFYHLLMKRESRRDSTNGGTYEAPDVENVRSSMIGEIETRSSHLLAIKADVEAQGEFVNFLIREVNCATYDNIDDVVAFVKWLDDELCFLVDERAVLKHFDWPEKKADTLREAAFGYRDLKKLESDICYFEDDPKMACNPALRKIVTLSEKMERTVYNLLRTRESLMLGFKESQIPVDWMMDDGIISKIKLGSVKLAQKYMNRVAMELQMKATQDKDPTLDYMLLQGVRFAFRIHQFAGGFDSETMHAFEEVRNLATLLSKK